MRALDSLKLKHNDMHESNILLRESSWEVVLIDPSNARTQRNDHEQLLVICERALPRLKPWSFGRRENIFDALGCCIGSLVTHEDDLLEVLSEMTPPQLIEWRTEVADKAKGGGGVGESGPA